MEPVEFLKTQYSVINFFSNVSIISIYLLFIQIPYLLLSVVHSPLLRQHNLGDDLL